MKKRSKHSRPCCPNPGVCYHECTHGLRRKDDGSWVQFRQAVEIDVRLGFRRVDRNDETPILDIEAYPEAIEIVKRQRAALHASRRAAAVREVEMREARARAEQDKQARLASPFVPSGDLGRDIGELNWRFIVAPDRCDISQGKFKRALRAALESGSSLSLETAQKVIESFSAHACA